MNAAYNDVLVGRQNLEIDKTVRKDRERLLRFIQTRVRNEDDAQDILQDVFWELIEAYRGVETIERVTSWLFQVARNKIVDLYRRKRREAPLPRTAEREDGTTMRLEEILPDLSDGPEELHMRDAIWQGIEGALEELPSTQRQAFVWHELEGMSFKEMSERTGETENALRLRKHYAMRALRTRLESLYHGI
jgi:RNA polymerase sigma factor (sigma-70 family)